MYSLQKHASFCTFCVNWSNLTEAENSRKFDVALILLQKWQSIAFDRVFKCLRFSVHFYAANGVLFVHRRLILAYTSTEFRFFFQFQVHQPCLQLSRPSLRLLAASEVPQPPSCPMRMSTGARPNRQLLPKEVKVLRLLLILFPC